MHETITSRLERRPTAASLAPSAAGLVPVPDRPGHRRQRGGGQSVDHMCSRRRSRHASISPTAGAPRRLSAEPLAQLPTILQRGPEVYGFLGQLWTRGRIVAMIQPAFGGSYHPRHVGRLCQAIRGSPQKPARRARQRDEAAIALWRNDTWPASKKGRRNSHRPSASEMQLACIRCPVSVALLPRLARPLACGNGGPVIISPLSARSRRRASDTSTARTA